MAIARQEIEFRASDEGKWCQQTLIDMEKDPAFHTETTFTSDGEHFPDHRMPFVTTHMNYLIKHHDVNPRHYISNLRLRSRK